MGYEKKGFETTNKKLINQCEINIKDTFGWVPKSVNKFMKIKEYEELIRDKYCKIRNVGNSGLAKQRGGGLASSLNYSIFNSGLADFIYKYFFNKNDKILDPFMGRATRPILANFNKLNYSGFDVDSTTIDFVKSRISSLKENLNNEYTISLFNEDGTRMNSLMKNTNNYNNFDGIFTCPPYWKAEVYSGEGNDLSHCETYSKYLLQMEMCFKNCYKLLKFSDFKNNKFHLAIFVVGSIRDGKSGLFDLDYDFQKIAKNVGFILHDKIIHENIPTTLSVTMRRNFMKRITAKAHETILIFRKGG